MTSKLFVVMMAMCLATGAQVNLTGTVTDATSGSPLSGALVTLKVKNMSDSTDAQGKYSIASPTHVKNFSGDIIAGSSLVGNHLTLNIAEPSPVTVEVFNAAGVKITTLFKYGNLSSGTYDINMSASGVGTGLYFIRVRQGNQCRVHQYLPIQRVLQGDVTHNTIQGSQKGIAKKLFVSTTVDTLVFNKTGYGTVIIPIQSYTGVVDTVLTPLPSAPSISSVSSGDGSVTVSWNTVSGATSYNLYYTAGTTVTKSGTKLTGVTSPKKATGLTNDTLYAFAVSAVNGGGESGLSAVQTATPAPTVTDTDGNVYHTVTIGTQVWMVENLKTTRYNDGTAIPLVTDGTTWYTLSTPGYCWYTNDSATYKNPYGALYNWYVVNTGKLAPAGWHVPTDSEWYVLTTFLGGENAAGGKLKEADTTHWKSPNTGATNTSGFTALPGGYRFSVGTFVNIGKWGVWWTSTAYGGGGSAWDRYLSYNSSYVLGHDNGAFDMKSNGFSVRCIKGDPVPMAPVISSAVAGDGSVTINWNTVSYATSYNLYYATGATVTKSGTKLTGVTSPKQVTGLTNDTLYAFAVSAVNATGESGLSNIMTATPVPPTVTDTDGNVYHTVAIGTQVWMVENLKTTRLNDGTAIPLVTDATAWSNLTTSGYCWYSNDSAGNNSAYNKLYNWFTVNTGKLAPAGWHVPTDSELTVLSTYLGGETVAGGKLKAQEPDWNGTNETGFSGLSSGERDNTGVFLYKGDHGFFWSSTVYDANFSWSRYLFGGNNQFIHYTGYKLNGFSVRCVRDGK